MVWGDSCGRLVNSELLTVTAGPGSPTFSSKDGCHPKPRVRTVTDCIFSNNSAIDQDGGRLIHKQGDADQ